VEEEPEKEKAEKDANVARELATVREMVG